MDAAVAVRTYLEYLNDPGLAEAREKTKVLRELVYHTTDTLERLKLFSSIEQTEGLDSEALRRAFVSAAGEYAKQEGITTGAFSALGVGERELREAGLLEGVMASSNGQGSRKVAVSSALTTPDVQEEEEEEPAADEDTLEWEDVPVDELATDDDGFEETDELGDEDEVADEEDIPAASKPRTAKGVKRKAGAGKSGATRSRVTQEDIVAMLPDEPFTIKDLVELSGASTLTVRRVISTLQDQKQLKAAGQDPEHSGAGRSPMRFQKMSVSSRSR